jgi:hypothetical protein
VRLETFALTSTESSYSYWWVSSAMKFNHATARGSIRVRDAGVIVSIEVVVAAIG